MLHFKKSQNKQKKQNYLTFRKNFCKFPLLSVTGVVRCKNIEDTGGQADSWHFKQRANGDGRGCVWRPKRSVNGNMNDHLCSHLFPLLLAAHPLNEVTEVKYDHASNAGPDCKLKKVIHAPVPMPSGPSPIYRAPAIMWQVNTSLLQPIIGCIDDMSTPLRTPL